jgi:guanylate kinase
MPPNLPELAKRLNKRGTEDAVTIEARLKKTLEEVPLISRYHYLVINDFVPGAVEKINAIVEAERMKPFRCTAEINAFKNSQENLI